MSLFYNEAEREAKVFNIIAAIVLFITACFIVLSFVGPVYNVWQQGLAGQAELKRAEQNRQIQILEAQAYNEAATSKAEATVKIEKANAEAEVERAKGAAQANLIIGDSLKGNDDYLRYLWIQQVAGKEGVIYVPTEANLPILEAGKR